ncbi:signal peptidase I [Bacillus sp. FJAT-44742]|uniref:signal peptidase I n=1 Tax=Bacillus sp. FJAT-44742 TaxID=2014005 RepID=UPI000C2507FE|nr:signal peptidase I [Bacillus sp. FJAT-44742]
MMKRHEVEIREGLLLMAFAFIIVAVTRGLLVVPIVVEGQSMMPALSHEDRVVVNKAGYWFSEPSTFDVVVFHATPEKDYIKRIIATPGDKLNYAHNELYLNEQKIEEPFLREYPDEIKEHTLTPDFTLEGVTGEVTVPEGYVFVLGDNRNHSLDSRAFGLVSIDDIIGKASFTFWPVSRLGFVP